MQVAVVVFTMTNLAAEEAHNPPPPHTHTPMNPLQALTQLAHLRLDDASPSGAGDGVVSTNILAGKCHLSHLSLGYYIFEAGALADKTQMQHLDLSCATCPGGVGEKVQLLSILQQLQQLTHLRLHESLTHTVALANGAFSPPAVAFAALTASSKLQHLDISSCKLPAGVWEHVFPAGRQLPHLQSLVVSDITQAASNDDEDTPAPAPESSHLASCRPGLKFLNLQPFTLVELGAAADSESAMIAELRIDGD